MAAQVLVERRDRVAVLTVSDPERRNALTLGRFDELAVAVDECAGDARSPLSW